MRPVGVDISKWQAEEDLSKPHGVDFIKLHDLADFIIMRAGYGGSGGGAWTDERVHAFMDDLAGLLWDNPKPFTFYWYFRDDVSIMDQVNRFAAVVNRWKSYVNLPLVVDAEVFVKGDELSTQKIIDFQTEVENQTDLKVDILYARAWQLNDETVPGLPEVLPFMWIARYDTRIDPQTGEPWGNIYPDSPDDDPRLTPRDYADWILFQYTDGGSHGAEYGVVSKSIDMNVYNGTMEELRHWAKLDEPVEPQPDWEDYGTAKAFEELFVAEEAGDYFFDIEETITPLFVSFEGAKQVVSLIFIGVVVDGISVILHRSISLYRRGYVTYEFERGFYLKPGDKVFASISVVANNMPAIKAKLIYK